MVPTNATSYSPGDEWRRALSVAEAVKEVCQALQLEPKCEWLRQVMGESADQMRAAVLWAASQRLPEDRSKGGLRNLVIAADAARSDAALALYFLNFLTNEELVSIAETEALESRLHEVEKGMEMLSQRLRTELGVDPYEATAG